MNVGAPSAPRDTGAKPAQADDAHRAERRGERPLAEAEQRRQGDAFDRLLRAKSQSPDDDAPRDDGPPPFAFALPNPVLPFAVTLHEVLRAAGAPADEPSATAAKASLGAALDTSATAAPALAPVQAGQWQVSLADPRGVPLELRAQRSDAAPWALTVHGRNATDTALLARHASKLDARLQARTVSHGHVRIEEQPPEGEA